MLEAMSGEKVVGMTWRVLLLVLSVRMSVWKGSMVGYLGCSPIEAAEMAVVSVADEAWA